jgi:hypothetical protein
MTREGGDTAVPAFSDGAEVVPQKGIWSRLCAVGQSHLFAENAASLLEFFLVDLAAGKTLLENVMRCTARRGFMGRHYPPPWSTQPPDKQDHGRDKHGKQQDHEQWTEKHG